METKRIFRIEHTKTKAGMWYNYDGTYNGIINTLTEGLSKDAPMKDLRDKKWFSAVSSMENLLLWFSPLDMQELKAKGYSLYEIECVEWINIGTEILFTREGIKIKKIKEGW